MGLPWYCHLRRYLGCRLLLRSVSDSITPLGKLGLTFLSIPEITDSDMADQAEMMTSTTGYIDKPLRKQYTLFFGVAAQFCYVGAQVGIASFFINFFTDAHPDLTVNEAHHQGANYYAIAQALFAVGRFSAAGFMYIGIKPRMVLLVYQTAIMIFLAAAIGVNTGSATAPNWGGLALLMVVLFFESCIFPIIFALVRIQPFLDASRTATDLNIDSPWPWSPHQAWCFLPRRFCLQWCRCPRHPRQRRRPYWHPACHGRSSGLFRHRLGLPHLPQHVQAQGARCVHRVQGRYFRGGHCRLRLHYCLKGC